MWTVFARISSIIWEKDYCRYTCENEIQNLHQYKHIHNTYTYLPLSVWWGSHDLILKVTTQMNIRPFLNSLGLMETNVDRIVLQSTSMEITWKRCETWEDIIVNRRWIFFIYKYLPYLSYKSFISKKEKMRK